MFRMEMKNRFGIGVAAAMLLLAGCGSNAPNTALPPVATNPNPLSPYGGGYYGGGMNCSAIGGQPLPNNPYQSQLQSQYGGGNFLLLTIVSAGPLQYGAGSVQRISAQGQFQFGDLGMILQQMIGPQFPATNVPPIPVCSTGTVMLNPDFSLQGLTLMGNASVPMVAQNPLFGGPPQLGGGQPVTVTLNLMNGYLVNSGNSGTIAGCFTVMLNGSPVGQGPYCGQ